MVLFIGGRCRNWEGLGGVSREGEGSEGELIRGVYIYIMREFVN